MLKDLTIKNKLLYGFIVIGSFAVISSLFSIYFLMGIKESNEEVGIKLAPLGDAVMELKLTAVEAHLIFEKIMGGDKGEDIKDVWDLLDETLWYCDAILLGDKNNKGTFHKTQNDDIRRKIENVKEDVEEFIKSAEARYSALHLLDSSNKEFDEKFDAVQEVLEELISMNKSNNQILYSLSESRYLLTNGHLLFEEFINGDKSINFDDVLVNFEEAQNYIEKLGRSEKIKSLNKDFAKFLKLAKQRNKLVAQSLSVGSVSDQNFDDLFGKIVKESNDAKGLIYSNISKYILKVRSHILMSIIVMILLSILILKY